MSRQASVASKWRTSAPSVSCTNSIAIEAMIQRRPVPSAATRASWRLTSSGSGPTTGAREVRDVEQHAEVAMPCSRCSVDTYQGRRNATVTMPSAPCTQTMTSDSTASRRAAGRRRHSDTVSAICKKPRIQPELTVAVLEQHAALHRGNSCSLQRTSTRRPGSSRWR
jgi:hypothetical protein